MSLEVNAEAAKRASQTSRSAKSSRKSATNRPQDVIPFDAAKRDSRPCPKCKHRMVMPIESSCDIIAKNGSLIAVHEQALKQWKAGGKQGTKPQLKTVSQKLACCCTKVNCLSRPDGSGCPECQSRGGPIIQADPNGGLTHTRCGCETCLCQCSLDYNMHEHHAELLKAAQQEHAPGLADSNLPAYQQQRGNDILQAHLHSASLHVMQNNIQNRDATGQLGESLAVGALSFAQDENAYDLPHFKKGMADAFGVPSANVRMEDGRAVHVAQARRELAQARREQKKAKKNDGGHGPMDQRVYRNRLDPKVLKLPGTQNGSSNASIINLISPPVVSGTNNGASAGFLPNGAAAAGGVGQNASEMQASALMPPPPPQAPAPPQPPQMTMQERVASRAVNAVFSSSPNSMGRRQSALARVSDVTDLPIQALINHAPNDKSSQDIYEMIAENYGE